VPCKRLQRQLPKTIARNLRIEICKIRGLTWLRLVSKQCRFLQARMGQQQPSQFESRIAGRADDGGLDSMCHYASSSLIRDRSFSASLLLGLTINTVSSPPTVPTTSGHPSAS